MAKNKRVLHYPRLDTVLMVEDALKKADSEISKSELLRRLPKQVMRQTLSFILRYLEERGIIAVSKKGVLWAKEETFRNLENLPNELQNELKKFIEACKSILKDNLLGIILFGSAAKGRRDYSDIDVCLVLDNSYLRKKSIGNTGKIAAKIQSLLLEESSSIFDIIIQSEGWITEGDFVLSPLLLEINENALLIYGRDYLKILKSRISQSKISAKKLKEGKYYGWQFAAEA